MGRKIIDLTGKDFGMFHVVKQSNEKYITESGHSLVQWDCVDKDGNEYKLLAQYLKTCPIEYNPYNKKGYTESKYQNNKNTWIQQKVNSWKENNNDGINHQRKKYDLIGQVFGDWEVLEEGEPYQNKCNKYTRRTWRCVCHHILNDGTECGNIEDVIEANLVRGKSSCCIKCSSKSNTINIGSIYRKYKVLEKLTLDPEVLARDCDYLCECQCKLKSKRVVKGNNLLNVNAPRRCGSMGCNEKLCIVDNNRQVIKHICKICGQMLPIECFRKNVVSTHLWCCLECDPYKPKQEKSIEQECLEYRYNYYQKRAEDKNFNFEFTIEEFNQLTSQPCFYCGEYSIPNYKYKDLNYCGIDRILSDRGYTKNNCVPCCSACNVMKMDLEPFEFLRKTTNIAQKIEQITNELNNNFNLTEEQENIRLEEKQSEKAKKKIEKLKETRAKRAEKLRKQALEKAIDKVRK